MSTGLSLRRISQLDELQALAGDWIDLWPRCSVTPFQRPEWLLSWLEAFRPAELCVIAGRAGTRLVGLAPMFIYTRDGQRVLVPVGAGITDYLDWLIDPAAIEEFIPAAFRELEMSPWDVLELLDLPCHSPLLRKAETHSNPCNVCPGVPIPPGADFNQVVPSRQRRNLCNARNRIYRAGYWKVEVANRDTLPEFLSTLFRLHRTRWAEQGESGVLADPRVRDFHMRSAPRLLQSGILRFYGIRLEGQLIAVLHTLVDRVRVYCYLQGFDTCCAEFSPGMLLLEAVVRDAIQEGKSRVDFLRGKEPYKYSWGAQDEPTFRIHEHPAQLSEAVKRRAA